MEIKKKVDIISVGILSGEYTVMWNRGKGVTKMTNHGFYAYWYVMFDTLNWNAYQCLPVSEVAISILMDWFFRFMTTKKEPQ